MSRFKSLTQIRPWEKLLLNHCNEHLLRQRNTWTASNTVSNQSHNHRRVRFRNLARRMFTLIRCLIKRLTHRMHLASTIKSHSTRAFTPVIPPTISTTSPSHSCWVSLMRIVFLTIKSSRGKTASTKVNSSIQGLQETQRCHKGLSLVAHKKK